MRRLRPSLAEYREHRLSEINELREKLGSLDCDPRKIEPYLLRLDALSKAAGSARLGDRLLIKSKIRDVNSDIEKFARRLTHSSNGSVQEGTAMSLSHHAGSIKLEEDPLAFQNRMRGEWP